VTIFQGFITKLGMKQLAKELLDNTNSKAIKKKVSADMF
jgi:hypothetical protein